MVFGGTEELEALKKATSETGSNGKDKATITASPLDYHFFRQEITSKYPSYIPPQPSIPLEAENTSLLPPLPNQTSRNNASNGILPGPPNPQNGGASILHQPVHIATPAPSPPPSPGIGGKGGKKQNYQTNQNFPFMYPPLDATSNSAGGKGMANLHGELVNRRWEGSDIPASILEAGELFSSRVRMTRATRQLWEEREQFLRFDRGWDHSDDEDEIEDLNLDELTLEEKEVLKEFKSETKERRPPPPTSPEIDFGPRPGDLSERDKQRLIAIENFYVRTLGVLFPSALLIDVARGSTSLTISCDCFVTTNPGQCNSYRGPAATSRTPWHAWKRHQPGDERWWPRCPKARRSSWPEPDARAARTIPGGAGCRKN